MGAARLLCSWDFPGKNTEVGCHFLLQGIFPTQESNAHLLHWQAAEPAGNPYEVPYVRELKYDSVQTMAETQISPKEQLMKLGDLDVMVILEFHTGEILSQYEQKKTQTS